MGNVCKMVAAEDPARGLPEPEPPGQEEEKKVKNLIGKLGGRKFIVALVALVGVIVAATTGLDLSAYENTIVGILGTFLLGQGIADGLSSGKTSTTTPD